jgi:alkylation response protein AidB-like acyl-CoA dehydrogenase
MIGGCEKILEDSNAYAKTRVQFERPIGSFQAIQHYLADIATEIAAARGIMYKAAWTVDEGLPAIKLVAIAKAFIGDTYRHVTAVGHQIRGGIGYTVDSDMGLYSLRAKSWQLMMGTSESWEEIVAQELGL